MRAVYTVQHERWSPGAKDAHGNTIEGWLPAVAMDVYAIAPRGSQEPGDGRDAVITGLSLYALPSAVLDPRDRFLIDGVRWRVEGEIADYTRGPFGWKRGKVVNLSKADG